MARTALVVVISLSAVMGLGAACCVDTEGLSGGDASLGTNEAGTDSEVARPDGEAASTDGEAASTDAGTDATKDASADAPTSKPTSIACGPATCTGGEVCCLTSPTILACATSCDGGALTIHCDDHTDCADNEVCCAFGWAGAGPPGDVSCTTSPCDSANDARRCILGQPSTCSATTTCSSDMTSTGYEFTSCQ